MTPGSTAQRTRLFASPNHLALILSLALAVAVGIGYDAPHMPILSDNQHYFYMAERAASGVSPYTSHFDGKPALSMLLTGAAIALGRPLGVPDMASARVLSLLCLALSAWVAWLVTHRLTRSWKASLLALLSTYAFSGYVYMAAMGSRPKVFLLLFMWLTLYVAVQERPFWAGLCASLAFLCWQPAILGLGVLVLVLLLGPNRWQGVGLTLLGALLPQIVYEFYFVLTGSLEEQVAATYIWPLITAGRSSRGVFESISLLAERWRRGFGGYNLLPLVAGLGPVVALVRFAASRRSAPSGSPISSGWLYVGLYGLACAALTIYDHQGYPDLFFILPFVSILSSYAIDALAEALGPRGSLAYALFAAYLIFLICAGSRLRARPFTLGDQVALAGEVAQMIDEGETVYSLNCAHLLAFNHMENWSRFGFVGRGVEAFFMQQTGLPRFTPARDGVMPSVVLYARATPRHARQWLDAEYKLAPSPQFEIQGIHIYRLVTPSK